MVPLEATPDSSGEMESEIKDIRTLLSQKGQHFSAANLTRGNGMKGICAVVTVAMETEVVPAPRRKSLSRGREGCLQ